MPKINVQKKVNVTRVVKLTIPIEELYAVLKEHYDVIPDDIPPTAINGGFAGEPGERVFCVNWEEVE